MEKHKTFSHLILGLIGYSLIVFLWGAWVRISGSGDGCGEHWPLCHGVLFPDSSLVKLWIENFHRISTKAYGFFVMGLIFMAFRWFPKGHASRLWICWTFFFTLIEGLIGAIIVLKGFVADDESPQRAILIAIHLSNTFLLMAALCFTWWSARADLYFWSARSVFQKGASFFLLALLSVGATGALAALSTTLFPSDSLIQSFVRDFSEDSHFLLQIRILHPVFAFGFLVAGFVWGSQILNSESRPEVLNWTRVFLCFLVVTFFIGVLTLGLLSPTVLKLVHLLFAHGLWISLILVLCALGASPKTNSKLKTK